MNGWAWCRGFDRRSSLVCVCTGPWFLGRITRILKSSCGVCVEIDVSFLMLSLDSLSEYMGAGDWVGWGRSVGAWDALRDNIGVCFSRRWVFDGDVDCTRSGGSGGGGVGDVGCMDMELSALLGQGA